MPRPADHAISNSIRWLSHKFPVKLLDAVKLLSEQMFATAHRQLAIVCGIVPSVERTEPSNSQQLTSGICIEYPAEWTVYVVIC